MDSFSIGPAKGNKIAKRKVNPKKAIDITKK